MLETLVAAIGCVRLRGMFSTGWSAEEKRTAIWLVALRDVDDPWEGKKGERE
jgi:hypothetical protein